MTKIFDVNYFIWKTKYVFDKIEKEIQIKTSNNEKIFCRSLLFSPSFRERENKIISDMHTCALMNLDLSQPVLFKTVRLDSPVLYMTDMIVHSNLVVHILVSRPLY
jgi:hypothetical protein